jgi:hypothetical protein
MLRLLKLSYWAKTLTEFCDGRMEYADLQRHPLLNACLSQNNVTLCFKYHSFPASHSSSVLSQLFQSLCWIWLAMQWRMQENVIWLRASIEWVHREEACPDLRVKRRVESNELIRCMRRTGTDGLVRKNVWTKRCKKRSRGIRNRN